MEPPFGVPEDDRFRALAPMPDGGTVAVGFTRSQGAGEDDAWVVRLDDQGRKVWAKTFGGALNDSAFDVSADPVGGITVAGNSRSPDTETYEAWLFRLSAEGVMQWQRRFNLGSFNAVSR